MITHNKARIWVDADACPSVIKDILFRAAQRASIHLTLIANRLLAVPPSPWIHAVQVPHGFDVADQEIIKRLHPGDLIITADIPLASEALANGGLALSPRGEFFSADTIQAQLTMRDFMDNLRASGIQTGGPPPFSQADRKQFAAQLDKWLAR